MVGWTCIISIVIINYTKVYIKLDKLFHSIRPEALQDFVVLSAMLQSMHTTIR